MPSDTAPPLLTTVLHAAHRALSGRMVPFAGYEMPVQYEGVLAEHNWTRAHAGLFDVSHMGPAVLALDARSGDGDADHRAVCALIEPLIPTDMTGLAPGQLRYTMLLNDQGGILDDLMIGRPADPARQGELFIVVNAGTKDADYARIGAATSGRATLRRLEDWGLLALQGPQAAAVLADVLPASRDLGFMQWTWTKMEGQALILARSGYTGEDGFEITLPGALAVSLWDRLLRDDRVKAIGLGARDSLRLEAGMPLYGHDLDETVSPVEAGLPFVVAKSRRAAADFPGAQRILGELANGSARIRVALAVQGAPAREGAEIADASGAVVGRVTSGGFSPTLSAPIAMGFVPPALAAVGTALQVIVRGRAQAAAVVALPFVPIAMSANLSRGPDPMRFTKDHEWVEVDGDVATVGITAYAAEQMGDVVFVELPESGKTVKPGDAFAVVESVKAASDVYCPVAGEVVAANADVADSPELINAGPENLGWLAKIKLSDPAAVEALMDRGAYETYLQGL